MDMPRWAPPAPQLLKELTVRLRTRSKTSSCWASAIASEPTLVAEAVMATLSAAIAIASAWTRRAAIFHRELCAAFTASTIELPFQQSRTRSNGFSRQDRVAEGNVEKLAESLLWLSNWAESLSAIKFII
jgi:hypothetical protein